MLVRICVKDATPLKFKQIVALYKPENLRWLQRDSNPAHVLCDAVAMLYQLSYEAIGSHGLLPSDVVAQSIGRRWSNPKVVGSVPTLVGVFLCPSPE